MVVEYCFFCINFFWVVFLYWPLIEWRQVTTYKYLKFGWICLWFSGEIFYTVLLTWMWEFWLVLYIIGRIQVQVMDGWVEGLQVFTPHPITQLDSKSFSPVFTCIINLWVHDDILNYQYMCGYISLKCQLPYL